MTAMCYACISECNKVDTDPLAEWKVIIMSIMWPISFGVLLAEAIKQSGKE